MRGHDCSRPLCSPPVADVQGPQSRVSSGVVTSQDIAVQAQVQVIDTARLDDEFHELLCDDGRGEVDVPSAFQTHVNKLRPLRSRARTNFNISSIHPSIHEHQPPSPIPQIHITMPPKRQQLGTSLGSSRGPSRKGFAKDTYAALTSPDNRSVVTSIAFFAVRRKP